MLKERLHFNFFVKDDITKSLSYNPMYTSDKCGKKKNYRSDPGNKLIKYQVLKLFLAHLSVF